MITPADADSCNRTATLVAVSLADHHDAASSAFLAAYRRTAAALNLTFELVPAVDGFNTTDVVESLLESRVPFRNLR